MRRLYGLNYQIRYLIDADRHIVLAGKKIFEVGGLPERLVFDEFNVGQSIGTENSSYWQELPEKRHGKQLVPGEPARITSLKDINSCDDLCAYSTVVGAIEELAVSS